MDFIERERTASAAEELASFIEQSKESIGEFIHDDRSPGSMGFFLDSLFAILHCLGRT